MPELNEVSVTHHDFQGGASVRIAIRTDFIVGEMVKMLGGGTQALIDNIGLQVARGVAASIIEEKIPEKLADHRYTGRLEKAWIFSAVPHTGGYIGAEGMIGEGGRRWDLYIFPHRKVDPVDPKVGLDPPRYAQSLDQGTKAGIRSYMGRERLLSWASSRVPEAEPWAVVHHIEKHGTRAHPYIRPAAMEALSDWKSLAPKLAEDLIRAFAAARHEAGGGDMVSALSNVARENAEYGLSPSDIRDIVG